MKIAVTFLAFIAVVQGTLEAGLRVRYDVTTSYGETSFFDVPRTASSAETAGWAQTDRPDDLMSQLVMYCYEDYVICTLYEPDTGAVAGLRISLPQEYFTGAVLDLSIQGFTNWTVCVNGTSKNFWSNEHYYVSEELLELSVEEREAARDSTRTLSAGYLWFRGFNGELMKVAADYDEFIKDTSFVEQACLPWMGRHFYYNMTSELPCTADNLLPWFPLVHSGEVVAIGLYVYGNWTFPADRRIWCEYPTTTIVENIAPSAPQCVYDMATDPGMVTVHTYFIEKVRSSLTCLFQ